MQPNGLVQPFIYTLHQSAFMVQAREASEHTAPIAAFAVSYERMTTAKKATTTTSPTAKNRYFFIPIVYHVAANRRRYLLLNLNISARRIAEPPYSFPNHLPGKGEIATQTRGCARGGSGKNENCCSAGSHLIYRQFHPAS